MLSRYGWPFRALALAKLALTLSVTAIVGCAARGDVATIRDVDATLRERAPAAALRLGSTVATPAGVTIADGLTQEEAVAMALWNSPAFQATLADLGIARADLLDAGLLRNPILSLLFPLGPKQLEFTLQYPFDVLVHRPARIAAATLNVQAMGQRLVWDGLSLVAQVRSAHADAILADRRLILAQENATLVRRLTEIAEARLRAGDISELEARAARHDALRSEAAQRAMQQDRDLARLKLAALLGLTETAAALEPKSSAAYEAAACPVDDARVKEALASRPDVRAAELGIEAATARARWERTRVLALIGILDANGRGSQGFEMGPGVNLDLPLFNRNQGGKARLTAEIERASQLYAAARLQVVTEVQSAAVLLAGAQQALDAWTRRIVPSLEIEQRQAEGAYQAGEIPLLNVLDVSRRLVDGRLQQLNTEADLWRSRIALDRAMGRYCRE